MSKGILLVVSAPSGCGKDAVIKALKESDFEFVKTVSDTTRDIREDEINGIDYTFISREEFEKRINDGYYLEHTVYSGNYYGTPKSEVEKRLNEGSCILMKIEVEGAGNIRRIMPDAVTVFLGPPSMEELERRLRNRGTETEESIRLRYEASKEELKCAPEYNYVVVNDVLEDCVEDIRKIVEVEMLQYANRKEFVDELLNNC